MSGTPVILDNHILTKYDRDTRTKLLDILRPGDMHTHFYNDRQVEVISRFSGKVQPYMLQARKRGVLFDMGHGAGSFLWPVASRAMAQGFPPDTISTDLHGQSIFTTQSDMPNCISKLMNLGMGLQDAITRSTVSPAKAIQRFPELGTLGHGKAADIAVLKYEEGVFPSKMPGRKNSWRPSVCAVSLPSATVRSYSTKTDSPSLCGPMPVTTTRFPEPGSARAVNLQSCHERCPELQ